MGTRHHQKVINKVGETKVAQYGQWDGYPEGQGIDILKFLKGNNLDEYEQKVSKIPQITDEEVDMVNADPNTFEVYPYLSRDCGSDLHGLIMEDKVKFLVYCSDEEANRHCAGFYLIDFQKNIFKGEFRESIVEYPLDDLPTYKTFLTDMGCTDKEIESTLSRRKGNGELEYNEPG